MTVRQMLTPFEVAKLPSISIKSDDEVWYYKLFRNGTLLAQIDGTENTWSDSTPTNDQASKYSVVAVNFFFKESELSKEVEI